MKITRLYCKVPGCSKSFRNEDALEEHSSKDHSDLAKTSSSEFRCSICPKLLSTKQSLKEHMYTHTGEKPYKCLVAGCGLMFRQSSQLSNHRKTHLEKMEEHFDNLQINLVFFSKLLSKEKQYIYSIPSEPFTIQDAELPKLR